jgi:hypothetical protein
MNYKESCCVGIFFLLLLPAVVFAGPIPELLPSGIAPHLLPPPIMPKFPPEPVVPYVQPQPHPPEASDYISGIRYYIHRFQLGADASGQADNSETSAPMHARESALLGSLNMSTDGIPDVEPSIIAIDKNATVWTTSVYIKRNVQPGNLYIKNVFSTTTDFTTVYKGEWLYLQIISSQVIPF